MRRQIFARHYCPARFVYGITKHPFAEPTILDAEKHKFLATLVHAWRMDAHMRDLTGVALEPTDEELQFEF